METWLFSEIYVLPQIEGRGFWPQKSGHFFRKSLNVMGLTISS